MTEGEWSLAAVHDVLAEAVPDREMLICGEVRRTFGEVQQRSRGLAAFLLERGIGLRPEREGLERWESGQDAVALVLNNGAEYIEAMLGAFRARVLEPGDDAVGWIARRGRVALGYLGDPERTEATFPIVDGQRVAIPGDRGQRLADGTIRMLGRDSMAVNTGGEKVFVEEVEAVLVTHPGVTDALVVGRPSERFGQEVVAVVAPNGDAEIDPAELREFVAAELARFKAPRAVALCEVVPRHANGKADYHRAQELAVNAVDATDG